MGDAVLMGMGGLMGKAVGALLLPILARVLSPAQLGQVDLLMSFGSAATAIALLGLDVAVLREYVRRRPDLRATVVRTWLGLAIPSGAVAFVVAAALAWRLVPPDLWIGMMSVGVVVPAQLVHVVALTTLRARGRAVAYALLAGCTFALYAILALLLLARWQRDANAVVLAWAGALAVAAIIGMASILPDLRGAFDRQLAVRLLRVGAPLMPGVALVAGAEFAYRGILAMTAGAHELGLFAVAVRIASLVALATGAIQLAWQPRAFALGSDREATLQGAAAGLPIIAVISAVAVGAAAAGRLLLGVFGGAAYADALPALGFCLAAGALGGVTMLGTTARLMSGGSRDVTLAVMAGLAAGLLVAAVLAPGAGSLGAAAGYATAQAVTASILVAMTWPRGVLPSTVAVAAVAAAICIVVTA